MIPFHNPQHQQHAFTSLHGRTREGLVMHDRRGMLKETLVVLASEFGRTPEVKAGRIGRDHHPSAFSALLAGGGIKEGYVHGVSDERAHYVEEKGVGMEELNATIAYTMGISVNKTIYSPGGRPFKVAHGSQPITDILA